MGSVGLLYVGAVLAVNGLMLLGLVEARSAAPINLFVGALQVVTPTYLIFTSGGDPAAILAASGIYLFGFTYLYVGINLLSGLDGTGVGWFSAFVAAAAVVYSALNFFWFQPADPAFGVIWLYWAILWGLFFLLLGRKRDDLTRFTGAIAVVAGIVTAAIPAFLLMTGVWADYVGLWAVVIAVLCLLSLLLYPRLHGPVPAAPPPPAPDRSAAAGTPSVAPAAAEQPRDTAKLTTPPAQRTGSRGMAEPRP
ncbi:AmiS/UreI family transporter [Geodermatophilus sp. YIM 151500]|uniref:AmiS/UreI family transporter n=1 Tax=Geodermatophilus sp. YIM 151500 TaxID=2984531 RepID=UPI0021E3DB2A|nr:AmiS/UreI family transporter [Geodermatophilus sp. YIM 151500]MCV2487897.1 AmiS/UreI family transporter [Geodermatophilus sp. YIM 151500]